MARLPYPSSDALVKAEAVADRIRNERGKLLNLYRMLLHSPPFADGWRALLSAVRNHGTLSPALRELAILRIAVLNRAPYEFDVHIPFGVAAGLSPRQVESLRDRETPSSLWSELERTVLQYVDEMTVNVQIDARLVHRLSQALGERDLVELTVTVAAYSMVSRFLEALKVDHDT